MNQISNHLEQLELLLIDMRDKKIQAIEFGTPGSPLGVMSHHRIQFIDTPSGKQPCIKLISRSMLGSGDYLGVEAQDSDIIMKAQHYLVLYFKPTPFTKLLKDRTPTELSYFPIN